MDGMTNDALRFHRSPAAAERMMRRQLGIAAEPTARTYWERIAPRGYRRSPVATERLVRERLDADGSVVCVETIAER